MRQEKYVTTSVNRMFTQYMFTQNISYVSRPSFYNDEGLSRSSILKLPTEIQFTHQP